MNEHIVTKRYVLHDSGNFHFNIRDLVDRQIQFSVWFDEGAIVLSYPDVGNRNRHNPQPTPPLDIALAA